MWLGKFGNFHRNIRPHKYAVRLTPGPWEEERNEGPEVKTLIAT